ncbi:hypothetical protein ES703_72442 [subsurface metagenome]
MSNKITSPEQFFGFQMGADKKIARWDKIVEYFNLLDEQSDRIKVVNLGPSTEGHPTLLVAVSSAENIKNIDYLKEVNAKLDDPRGLNDSQVEALIKDGKATILQSGSMHAGELGGTQMMPELIYDLLTRTDEETERIQENVISLFIPCANPDGNIMVCDYYEKYLGTEYEGNRLPWLYQKYCGHDNNRDAYGLNMVTSLYWSKVMYRDWYPHVWQDHHHMGFYSPRFMVSAPQAEPIAPHCDPLGLREVPWYGAHMACKLEEAGKTGVITDILGTRGMAAVQSAGVNVHNVTAFLTESASAKLATPVYVHPDQLDGGEGGMATPETAQNNFPNPWEGGWWRLRDIVEQIKIASWAMLDMAARNKETVLKNRYLKAKRQTERGEKGKPYAYVITLAQHDPLTTIKLVDKLLLLGIEVKRAQKEFTINGLKYPEGSYVIFLAQPKMGAVKTLLGRTVYPENKWTRLPDGTPTHTLQATDTLNEFMGVRVKPIDSRFGGDFEVIKEVSKPAGKLVGESKTGYIFDGRLNDSFQAVNQLLTKGITVERVDEAVTVGGKSLPAGAFLVSADGEVALKEIAADSGIKFYPLDKKLDAKTHKITQLRVGMYERYWGGNMAEGWTEFVLDQFGFPYTLLKDADIKKGDLNKDYDVIIIPDDSIGLIMGEEKGLKEKRISVKDYPPEYRSGLGEEGTEALKSFVKEGGTLLAFNEASNYAIEYFDLPVKNAVKDLSNKDYFCPSSTLNLTVDSSHPLGYGMPEDSQVLVLNSPVFSMEPSNFSEQCEIVVRYPEERDPERSLLQSGRLIGEEKMYGKAAMVSAKSGKGKVVLTGFNPYFRGQTHATFKILFNCLLS